jgi:hypothetical protein
MDILCGDEYHNNDNNHHIHNEFHNYYLSSSGFMFMGMYRIWLDCGM